MKASEPFYDPVIFYPVDGLGMIQSGIIVKSAERGIVEDEHKRDKTGYYKKYGPYVFKLRSLWHSKYFAYALSVNEYEYGADKYQDDVCRKSHSCKQRE
ncbi:MAG: hypothetical protein IJS15_16450 [Victivallales bacterium]|nr:hypothetical protein [Victivallales bacterium]